MIRLIVKLGHWLETRFPEKLLVKAEEYLALKEQMICNSKEMEFARHEVALALEKLSTLEQRMTMVEQAAVHKGAVQDLVSIVKAVKDELQTLKTNIGFANPELAKIEAHFNGEPVSIDQEK